MAPPSLRRGMHLLLLLFNTTSIIFLPKTIFAWNTAAYTSRQIRHRSYSFIPRKRLLSQLHVGSSLFSSRETATSVNATTTTSPTSTATLLAQVVKNAKARQASAKKKVGNQANQNISNDDQGGETNDLVLVPDELIAGIGGLNGTSFDVNRLKRNLLQEVVQAYKQDLHTLLQSYQSTEQEVVEKLSALVQSSPVRTTTDSNLLDGTWALAYRSKHCVVRDLKQRPSRMPRRQRQQQAKAQNVLASSRKSGKERFGRKFFRTVHLEEEDDDVVIEDTMHLFGPLLKHTERYQVCGLTRQALDIKRQSTKWYFLRNLVKQRSIDTRSKIMEEPMQKIQVVYLDVDLCILTNTDEGDDSTFSVYTKNEAWLGHSMGRQRRFFSQALRHFLFGKLSQQRIEGDDGSWWKQSDEANRILQEIQIENSSRLRVLRLGDTTDVDEAWEGKEDPFVHLSADERQQAMKAMNMKQIELAANKRLSKVKRETWLEKLVPRRKSFQRPRNL